jgi:hypothetical protein
VKATNYVFYVAFFVHSRFLQDSNLWLQEEYRFLYQPNRKATEMTAKCMVIANVCNAATQTLLAGTENLVPFTDSHCSSTRPSHQPSSRKSCKLITTMMITDQQAYIKRCQEPVVKIRP